MSITRVGMAAESVVPPPGLKQRVFALEQWIGQHVRDESDRAILLEALRELAEGIRTHSH